MNGKVIAVANMKGGVGKTATVVALAETLAALGHSVLVVDADAQANASICIAGDGKLEELIESGRTIDAYLDDVLVGGRKLNLRDCIFDHASPVSHGGWPLNVSLLAASSALRTLDRELVFSLTKRQMGLDAIVKVLFRLIERDLSATGNTYEYILIDCAPGISAITEACLRLANLVIVPTIPDFLSSYGLKSFCATMDLRKSDAHGDEAGRKRLPHVLVSRRRPVKEHDRYLEKLQKEWRAPSPTFMLFRTIIPEAVAMSAALATRQEYPTFIGKWGAPLVSCFSRLATETREAMNGA